MVKHSISWTKYSIKSLFGERINFCKDFKLSKIVKVMKSQAKVSSIAAPQKLTTLRIHAPFMRTISEV